MYKYIYINISTYVNTVLFGMHRKYLYVVFIKDIFANSNLIHYIAITDI